MLELCVPNVAYLQNPLLVSLAVHWGSVELVRKLIDFGADPFYMDEDGGNALHYLNISSTEPLVRMLLDMPLKPVLTKDGLSPAETMFSFKSHPELSDCGRDRPLSSDHRPFDEPFEVAAYEALLTDDILDSRDSNGAGLWERFASVVLGTWAAKWPPGATGWTDGLHDAVRCLIKKGALLRYEEEKGECAIFPVLSGWLKTASEHKADTKFLGAVMATIMKASTEADGFGESAAAVQCLKRAVQLDHTELVAELLGLRVSVHAPHEGTSALETACMPRSTCQPATFDRLLEHADASRLDDVDSLGVGLLYRFLDHKIPHHEHKLSAVLRKGCDPDAKTPGGAPMVVAYIEERRTDAALALLEAGADPAASSKTGVDAALAAASQGDLRVLLRIRESRSGFGWGRTCTHDFHRMHDPGARRKKDCNALHLAAASGSPEVVRFYLEVSDLDVESKTADGWRPIHFAAAAAACDDDVDGSCVRVLLEHGADPTAGLPSQGHWDPLGLATRTGGEAAEALPELGSQTVGVPEGPL
ncbi:ankyrin [Colletotrichum zoysiae]|uniref:Ankyrin n=1 Tax=Colletotrichum zoysiae TaxID=1216348 RepID=A0AAD9M710_9PEZI|nr:ankyrin [Colletotrichum zoysiae]